MKFTIFSLLAFGGAVLALPAEKAEASANVVAAKEAGQAAANPPPPAYGNGYGYPQQGYAQPNYGYGGGKPGYGPRGPPPGGFQYYQYPQPGYYQQPPPGYYVQPGYGYGNRWW